MSNEESNIAVSFRNIHNIITRALSVSIENAALFIQQDAQGRTDLGGFFNFNRALTSVVNAHHLTEEEIAFPYFRELLPDVPFDELSETHHLIVRILSDINHAIATGEKKEQPLAEIKILERALVRFDELWHPHIIIEADELFNKVDALIPVEEQLRLVRQFGEHGQRLSIPPYFNSPIPAL